MILGKDQKGPPGYNARLNWALLNKCNLNCAYCINPYPDKKNAELFLIDIPALLGFLEGAGKIFRINFLGGEPFLVPNLIEACEKITEKHYVSFNTNLTSSRVKDLADKINPKNVIEIIASAHVKELERRRLLNTYMGHVLMLRERGFNVRTKAVAHPSLVSEASKYKQLFLGRGVDLKFSPFVGRYKKKLYPLSYTDQELKIFGLRDMSHLKRSYYQRKRVCNAGYNAAVVDTRGDIYVCDRLRMKIGNIYNDITFGKGLVICPFKSCICPFAEVDPSLLQKALDECGDTREIINFYQACVPIICQEIDRRIGLVGLFVRRRCPGIYSSYKRLKNKYQAFQRRNDVL